MPHLHHHHSVPRPLSLAFTHPTGMIEDSCLILHVTLPGHCGALTYYLPVCVV